MRIDERLIRKKDKNIWDVSLHLEAEKKTVINTEIYPRLCRVPTIMSFALGHRILSAF